MSYKVTELRVCYAEGCAFAKVESFYAGSEHKCPRCGAVTFGPKQRKRDYSEEGRVFTIGNATKLDVAGMTGTVSEIDARMAELSASGGNNLQVMTREQWAKRVEEQNQVVYNKQRAIGYNENDRREHQRKLEEDRGREVNRLRSSGVSESDSPRRIAEFSQSQVPYVRAAGLRRSHGIN
jgi:hypothetical protein